MSSKGVIFFVSPEFILILAYSFSRQIALLLPESEAYASSATELKRVSQSLREHFLNTLLR